MYYAGMSWGENQGELFSSVKCNNLCMYNNGHNVHYEQVRKPKQSKVKEIIVIGNWRGS